MSKWLAALKEYSKQRGQFIVPKKGTPEYEAVKKIENKLAGNISDEKPVKKVVEKTAVSEEVKKPRARKPKMSVEEADAIERKAIAEAAEKKRIADEEEYRAKSAIHKKRNEDAERANQYIRAESTETSQGCAGTKARRRRMAVAEPEEMKITKKNVAIEFV